MGRSTQQWRTLVCCCVTHTSKSWVLMVVVVVLDADGVLWWVGLQLACEGQGFVVWWSLGCGRATALPAAQGCCCFTLGVVA